MKQKVRSRTNVDFAAGSVIAEAKSSRRHGPPKERVQITVRLDQLLMERAYTQMQSTNARFTDVLERGLELALKEQDEDLPLVSTQVRFLVNNATKQQQVMLRRFLAFLVWDQIAELSPVEKLWRASVLEGLEVLDPLYQKAVPLYQRYGRSTEEVAELTGS